MTTIIIIFGGKTPEHDNSVKSAISVMKAIDKSKYEIKMVGINKEGKWLLYDGSTELLETGEWRDYAGLKLLADPGKYNLQVLCSGKTLKSIGDIAFPVIHGPSGEDGAIQGLLETIGMPYVGCRTLGTGIIMDKEFTRVLCRQKGIPVGKWHAYTSDEIQDNIMGIIGQAEDLFAYPMFVKPARMDSGMGITKAHNKEELKAALVTAKELDSKILIEENMNCREVKVGIIGNSVPLASAIGEITYSSGCYNRDTATTQIPAPLSAETTTRCKELAIKAYKTLGLEGFAEVEFFIERGTGQIYLNEINAVSHFTDKSIFPKLWEEVGLSCTELIDRLIGYSMEK